MNELLNLAVNSHWGLERWNKLKSVKVAASITGAIWFVKSKGDALKDVVMKHLQPGEQRGFLYCRAKSEAINSHPEPARYRRASAVCVRRGPAVVSPRSIRRRRARTASREDSRVARRYEPDGGAEA
jgi:hypothetical protein